MKLLITALAAMILMSFSCGKLSNYEKLEGTWVTVERPFNTKEILKFGPDSNLVITKETELNASYKVEGDKLISRSVEPTHQTEFTDTAKINFSGDTLIMKRKHHDIEKISELTRVTANGRKSIIGKWNWQDELGRPGIITYKENGELTAKLQLDEKSGKYIVQNDSLSFVFPGTTLRDLAYRFKEDTLFITTPDGKRELAHVRYKDEEE